MADNRYDKVRVQGVWLDEYTKQALEAVEKDLGYDLTIVQGSYNKGRVSASAGTHDGGGVVDLAPAHHAEKVAALRKHGFAAWYRPALAGVWNAHVHAVQIGNAKLSAGARSQVVDYKLGRNGLANKGKDPSPRPARISEFKYTPPMTPVEFAFKNLGYGNKALNAAAGGYAKRVPGLADSLVLNDPDVICVVETGSGKYLALLVAAMKKRGYLLVPKGGHWRHIFIRDTSWIRVKKSGCWTIDVRRRKHAAYAYLLIGDSEVLVTSTHLIVTPAGSDQAKKERYDVVRNNEADNLLEKVAAFQKSLPAKQPEVHAGDFNSRVLVYRHAFEKAYKNADKTTAWDHIDQIYCSMGNTSRGTYKTTPGDEPSHPRHLTTIKLDQ